MEENMDFEMALEHLIYKYCDVCDENDIKQIEALQNEINSFLDNLPFNDKNAKNSLMSILKTWEWPEFVITLYHRFPYAITKEEYNYCRKLWPDLKPNICEDIEARFRKD